MNHILINRYTKQVLSLHLDITSCLIASQKYQDQSFLEIISIEDLTGIKKYSILPERTSHDQERTSSPNG